MKFRVRRIDDGFDKWAVADGCNYKTSVNYIQRDGTVSGCESYDTEDQAQKALDLYLEKQEQPEHKFKVGDKVRVVADEERLGELAIPEKHKLTGVEGKVWDVGTKSIGVDFGSDYGSVWSFEKQDLELVKDPIEIGHAARTFVGYPEGALEVKDTNPKDALGTKKAPLSTLPTGPMYEVALAMLEGARKYGRHNYRVMGVKASVYYDAAMGHITAWWEGEDMDPTSGLHHLAKAMASLAVVRDSEMMGNWVDDRPPRYPDGNKLMRNHPVVADILKRYPECKKPFCHKVDHTVPTPGDSKCERS